MSIVVRPSTASRARRLAAPVATAVTAGMLWAGVALVGPTDGGPIRCPLKALTGLDCPFCGSTRAADALAHGDLVAALDHNAFFVLVAVPLTIVALCYWLRSAWRATPLPVIPTRVVVILGSATAAWWALRLAVPWLGSALS